VRVVLFGDSNTDRCTADPDDRTSYVSVAPALGPDAPHRACQVAGKIEAGWEALSRSETIRAVNHAISSTATGGGGFGWQDRTTQGSPNARTVVNGTTRFEAEILGAGFPGRWGARDQYFPNRGHPGSCPGAANFAWSMGTKTPMPAEI
jgi:hypothetical protein